jgi:uncharacterized membrane protein
VRGSRFIQAFLAGVSVALGGMTLVVSLKLAPPDALVSVRSYVIAAVVFLIIIWRKIDVAAVAIAAMVIGKVIQ